MRILQYSLFVANRHRLRAKIKTIGDKFEAREAHFKSLLRWKDAEVQCLAAKCEEYRRIIDREATKSKELTERAASFSATEAELRAQLNIYVEKFKQVCSMCLRHIHSI